MRYKLQNTKNKQALLESPVIDSAKFWFLDNFRTTYLITVFFPADCTISAFQKI